MIIRDAYYDLFYDSDDVLHYCDVYSSHGDDVVYADHYYCYSESIFNGFIVDACPYFYYQTAIFDSDFGSVTSVVNPDLFHFYLLNELSEPMFYPLEVGVMEVDVEEKFQVRVDLAGQVKGHCLRQSQKQMN